MAATTAKSRSRHQMGAPPVADARAELQERIVDAECDSPAGGRRRRHARSSHRMRALGVHLGVTRRLAVRLILKWTGRSWAAISRAGPHRPLRRSPRGAIGLAIDHLRGVERDGDHLACLVHRDNTLSKRLLAAVGWRHLKHHDDYEFWIGALYASTQRRRRPDLRRTGRWHADVVVREPSLCRDTAIPPRPDANVRSNVGWGLDERHQLNCGDQPSTPRHVAADIASVRSWARR